MMKKTTILLFLLWGVLTGTAQPASYYNGTAGKTGDDLKQALHEIINGHIDFTYSFSSDIFKYTDQDPQNVDNVILLYTRRSHANDDYGTGGDYINREHVWAKSHGDFEDIRPMDSDVHNLHPTDASVNVVRSNKDFDEVTDGTINAESGSEYNATSWEPADAAKGQVARTILYMAVRYEGTNGEIDLEAVDAVDTSPAAEHGKLSTLLEWNRNFPPDAFERRRNDRIFEVQRNRNPFVDNPEFVDLIWNGQIADSYRIGDVTMTPEQPMAGQEITLSAVVVAPDTPDLLKAYWGTTYDSEVNNVDMVQNGGVYTAIIPTTAFQEQDTLYYKLAVAKADTINVLRGSYCFPRVIAESELTAISDVQGTGSASPLDGQQVTIAGRVIANFDNNFYIQSGSGVRSGICVYNEIKKGKVGDSIVVTATVDEYNTGLTEVTTPSYLYVFNDNQEVTPATVAAADIDEDYEGMLVTITSETINTSDQVFQSAKSYNLSTQDLILRVQYYSRLIGKTIPNETVNITGVIAEYNGDYQIMPRDENDIEIVTSSSNNLLIEGKLLLYPNPAAEKVVIQAIKSINNVSIIDITGREIRKLYVEKPETEIQLDGLRNGIYLIKIELNDASLQVRRLVVRK